jgi:hypothetical protein
MFNDAALRIELHRGPNVSVLEVQDDRALIGSGAHCDLRLAPDEAAVEQLVIEAIGGDEVYARARAVQPVCLLNGAPFLEGRLSPASVLELGSVALSVQRVERQDTAKKPQRKRQSATSPTIQALGLIAVALGLWHSLHPKLSTGGALASEVGPPPSAAIEAQSCPVARQAGALALARQTLIEAESKRERAPFYPGDGTVAAPLFAQAAACFQLAGDYDAAVQASAAAQALAQQIADAIHVGHVRLERFLVTEQFADARTQAEMLASLVTDKHGDYSAWLAGVRRECELRADQVKR